MCRSIGNAEALGGLELRWGLEGKLSHSGSRDGADRERQRGENTLRGVCLICRQQPERSHEGAHTRTHAPHTHTCMRTHNQYMGQQVGVAF